MVPKLQKNLLDEKIVTTNSQDQIKKEVPNPKKMTESAPKKIKSPVPISDLPKLNPPGSTFADPKSLPKLKSATKLKGEKDKWATTSESENPSPVKAKNGSKSCFKNEKLPSKKRKRPEM